MKTYTTAQLSRIAKRSTSVISRLVKESKLVPKNTVRTKAGRNTYSFEFADKENAIAVVHKLVPRGGFRKNIALKAKAKTPANLAQVLRFMELPEDRRELLLNLGEKVTNETLELLMGLV